MAGDVPAVLVDSREQRPWQFPDTESRQAALTDADYTLAGFADVFGVERKSLNDLANCCGTDRERFQDQVRSATDSLREYAIVVEASREQVRRGDYYSNIHPNSILGTAESWPDNYGFDWYFEPNRSHAKDRALRILGKWYAKYS